MLERLQRAASRRGVLVLAIQVDQAVDLAAEFDTTFMERFQANRPRKGLAKAV